jgi:AcrR family transcriptional regulator
MTGRKPRSRYHHKDLRNALVAASWEVLDREGPEGLSLRALAERLGVSHAAPAHHFPDKAALLDALRTEAFTAFADELAGAPTSPPEGPRETPIATLRRTGSAYVAFARRHPNRLRLIFSPHDGSPSEPHRAASERAWSILETRVAAVIGEARASSPGELRAMVIAAWAAVHGLATLEFPPPECADPGAEAAFVEQRLLDVVAAGLVAPVPATGNRRTAPPLSRERP